MPKPHRFYTNSFTICKSVLIVNERNRRIISGEISLGRAICPITISVADHRGLREVLLSGRIMSMDQIRVSHMERMEALSLLRNSKASTLTMDQCYDILRKRQGR